MMDQLYRPRGSSGSSPSGTPGLSEGQDPLMQLLQQISGGGAFPGMEGAGGLPPGMESMMSGMMGGAGGAGGVGGGAQAVEQKGDRWGMWWSVVHALAAFMLAIWAVRSYPGVFDGSESMRAESATLAASDKPVSFFFFLFLESLRRWLMGSQQLFRYFALMELLLQSTRFLLEKGRPPQGSMLTTIAGFLPQPFSTYLSTLARYSVFLWAILQDAGVVIFVLGVAAWWNSS
jgi:hypothetical protein